MQTISFSDISHGTGAESEETVNQLYACVDGQERVHPMAAHHVHHCCTLMPAAASFIFLSLFGAMVYRGMGCKIVCNENLIQLVKKTGHGD